MNETDFRCRVESILNEAWTDPGFCVPNLEVYPHQWLWDSCFHSIIWAELGDDRAVVELETALAHQHASGFVPHMTYWSSPGLHEEFWGRPQTSSITQPPMFGHAAAQLHRRGFEVGVDLRNRITNAFRYLFLSRPRTPQGLIPIYHPWESGCDDSPRWDVETQAEFDADVWRQTKSDMVGSLCFDEDMSPVKNPLFSVGSVGFNALVLFNFEEFCTLPQVTTDPTIVELRFEYETLRRSFIDRWSLHHNTWVDDVQGRSPALKTADGALGLLVEPRSEIFKQLRSAEGFGGVFGCRGVHIEEPTYDPSTYWRGPSWPQLNYLLAVAASRAGETRLEEMLRESSRRGAERSNFAEYWNPDTGFGLGAIPQTWSGLPIVST